MESKCKQCNSVFTAKRKSAKYCSKFCREKYFRLYNKEWISNYNKQRRRSVPKLCKFCDKEITDRKHGKIYCSKSCQYRVRQINDRKFRVKVFKLYSKHKENLGCSICGYNKCGACLDFHHVSTKSRRITAKMWYSNSKTIQDELKKCILVCKNCHYELHNDK